MKDKARKEGDGVGSKGGRVATRVGNENRSQQ